MNFTKEEKIAAFDKIETEVFNTNFANLTKQRIETLLFSIYLDKLIDSGEKFDDYTLGEQLGITQGRVRTLKERKQLLFPKEGYNWKENFLQYLEYSRVSENQIKVNIPDVNVIKDLRHFLEEHNLFDNYQLNPKVFSCDIDVFISLCECLNDDNEAKDYKPVLDELITKYNDEISKSFFELIKSGNYNAAVKLCINRSLADIAELLVSQIPIIGTFGGKAVKTIINANLKNQ